MGKKLFKRSMAIVLMLVVLSTGLVVNAEGTYTVEKGDYLKKIAQTVYGDSARWEDIYEANKGAIKNPNIIYKGQVLVLPDVDAVPVPQPEPVPVPAETPEVENPEAAVPAETVAENTAMTLELWTVSEECLAIETLVNEIMKEAGISVTIRADGNTLVYEYIFTPEMWGDATAEEIAAAFGESGYDSFMESQRGIVDGLRQEFATVYGITLDGIRYVYYAPDGTPVYSAELKNE